MSSTSLYKANCHVSASTTDGNTVAYWSRNTAGVFDAFVGSPDLNADPLLPPFDGHRGPSDISSDGRYVLLTQAEGTDRAKRDGEPGKGSANVVILIDRETNKSFRLVEKQAPIDGIIWPRFDTLSSSVNGGTPTRMVWARMLKAPPVANFPMGDWDLRVGDLDLSAGKVSNIKTFHDPSNMALYEAYGWLPNTDRIVFMSTMRSKQGWVRASQLWTIRDDLDPSTVQRLSPPYVSANKSCGQTPSNVFHEFAMFKPGDPYSLYTDVGAETAGGNDVFVYDLRTMDSNGMLATPPKRLTFYSGGRNNWCMPYRVPGWPPIVYRALTTRVWTPKGILQSVCPDIYCTKTDTWLVNEDA